MNYFLLRVIGSRVPLLSWDASIHSLAGSCPRRPHEPLTRDPVPLVGSLSEWKLPNSKTLSGALRLFQILFFMKLGPTLTIIMFLQCFNFCHHAL